MRNVFAPLLNRADTLKGRLILTVAGLLCALILAPVIAPIITPSTQAEAPRNRFNVEDSEACSGMYGCSSQHISCGGICQDSIDGPIWLPWYPDFFGGCCDLGVETEGSCSYCE